MVLHVPFCMGMYEERYCFVNMLNDGLHRPRHLEQSHPHEIQTSTFHNRQDLIVYSSST